MSRLLLAFPILALALVAAAVPPDGAKKAPPAKGSPDESLAQVQVEKGLAVEVWAAEPLLRNPVAFAFDEKGRAFVVETNRLHTGVPDTRNFMKWLDDDLASRSIADRVAMYKTHGYGGFEKNDDLVRMVWDSTGGGKADKSTVFSSGYNRPEDGLGAGVLARKGSVYFANIPDLYVLKDTDGDGRADEKKSLFTGFGLAVQFVGHDLHGLRMGPDGKLYFTVGDRGFNVTTKEGKQLLYPNTGAVLRCDPDGSNLEVVHSGLRNPQEIAFDDFGNLFTYDNNSDSGDRARWVYVVEGGDSGWRGGYQYGTLYHPPGVPQGNRGPWNAEKIWHVPGKDGEPPAYVVPPLANFGNGPAGLTHYPGVGLNSKYKDHFFACDFTSNAGSSVIWSVAVTPKGAGFEVRKPEPFVRGVVPTDCEFGPDGAFYWSDWIAGWGHPNKGRLFRLTDPEAMKNPAVGEAKKLLAEGFTNKTVDELAELLEHPHQQVRMEAQFELVGRAQPTPPGRKVDEKVLPALAGVLKGSKNRIARLHAIWGLGVFGYQPRAVQAIVAALKDPDDEVRKNAVKAAGGMKHDEWERLGEGAGRPFTPVPPGGRNEPRSGQVAELLNDPNLAVRAAAIQAYVKLVLAERVRIGVVTPGSDELLFGPVFELLKTNNDADSYLRHAAIVALESSVRNPVDLFNAWTLAKAKYDHPAVRLGVVLALRRHKSEKVAEFLTDADPRIVAEAARAIHDLHIDDGTAKLAALAELSGQADPVIYRALAANYTLGTPAAAARVAKYAARPTAPAHVRVFALKLLADWANPPRRDPITGLIHDLPKREIAVAAAALTPVIAGVFTGPDAVRAEAARVASALGIKEVGPLLAKIVRDAAAPAASRADALHALAAVKDPALGELTAFALTTDEPKLRAAAITVKAKADPAAVLKTLPALLKDGKTSLAEKQAAFAVLATVGESEAADKLLAEWLTAAGSRNVPPELLLDIVEAADTRAKTPKLVLHASLKKGVERFEGSKVFAADNLSQWAETLAGGDADKGRAVFLNNAAVYCQRCHKLDGQGGEVGPPLNGLAGQEGKDRRYLLESMVLPSAKIAKGYETVILTLADGRTVTGVVKEETKKQIKLVTPEAKELVVPADEVESRRTGPSAMPDDLHKKLTRRELRDVVEFLAGLKEPEKKGGR